MRCEAKRNRGCRYASDKLLRKSVGCEWSGTMRHTPCAGTSHWTRGAHRIEHRSRDRCLAEQYSGNVDVDHDA